MRVCKPPNFLASVSRPATAYIFSSAFIFLFRFNFWSFGIVMIWIYALGEHYTIWHSVEVYFMNFVVSNTGRCVLLHWNIINWQSRINWKTDNLRVGSIMIWPEHYFVNSLLILCAAPGILKRVSLEPEHHYLNVCWIFEEVSRLYDVLCHDIYHISTNRCERSVLQDSSESGIWRSADMLSMLGARLF